MEKGDFVDLENFPNSIEEWLPEVERQDNELIAWIDEFIESDEYAELLKKSAERRSKLPLKFRKKHFPSPTSLQQDDQTSPNMYYKKYHIISLKNKIKESLVNLEIANTVANQRRGIGIIRDKMWEVKLRQNQNNYDEMLFENKKGALRYLRKTCNFSVHSLDITDRVLECFVKARYRYQKRKETIGRNKITVIANVLKDVKWFMSAKKSNKNIIRRKMNKTINKVYEKNSTLDDYSVEEIETDETDQLEEPEVKENILESNVKLVKKENKKTIIKKAATEKIINKSNKSTKKLPEKKSKSGKSKLSLKDEKGKADESIPSNIPNINPRKKILPEIVMTEVLENITKLYNYLREKESYELENNMTPDMLMDEGFFSRPNKLIFKDFVPNKQYKKVASIINGNSYSKNIRLDRVVWNADVEEDLLLEVEAFGVCRVLPGMSLKVVIHFNPEVLNKTADGKIIFITNKPHSKRAQQFVLNVVCVPLCAAVIISPSVVSFEEMPIWRAQCMAKNRKNYKIVRITNSGLKECKVVITKIFNNQTMEQEWKKIISIIRIDDSIDGEKKQLSSSNLEDPSNADPFPRNLVQQCVENIFNVFKFERNVFNVDARTTIELKCWLKNVSEVGYQVETYNFSIYERFIDGQLYCIGSQDVIVNSETTSHFLTSNVEILDFEVCVYGSVYQLDFELTNPCKIAHQVRTCFPSRMKSYLRSSPPVSTILPNQTIKICIKFIPIEGILLNNKFYDSEVCLLEFPVYTTVQTRGFEDTPPLRIDVFAAVTEAQGVILECTQNLPVQFVEKMEYFDLGKCTTMDSVYLDVIVFNKSLVPQQFGFLNLPNFISLMPNFGFGQLRPLQKATVRMTVSPSKIDVLNNSGMLKFQLILNSIKKCGALKQKSLDKNLAAELKKLEDSICKSGGSSISKLRDDLNAVKHAVKDKSLSISTQSTGTDLFMQAMEDDEYFLNLIKYDMEEEKEISPNLESPLACLSQPESYKSHILNFYMQISYVAVELSHQILVFPDTPCGSYSSMCFELMVHKVLGMKNQTTFEIFEQPGDDNDYGWFEVQPSYGEIKSGRKKVITVVVRPQVPEEVIKKRALSDLQKKLEAEKELTIENKNRKQKSKGKDKNKKDQSSTRTKSGKSKRRSTARNTQDIIDSYDYYQSEMSVWRTLEPYIIERTFTCRVTYNGIKHNPEEIYFKATCKVVSPNFIHDQKYQVIDFGSVAIGTTSTKTINVQNIQRSYIAIDAFPLNPVGPFSSSAGNHNHVPPEYILSYPIKFIPYIENSHLEYFNVTSDKTSYVFILRGVGIKPNLSFTPNFTVCRLTASPEGYQDCTFDIRNNCDVKVTLSLEKICELEGEILYSEVLIDDKKVKTTKSQREKFSLNLTDDEIYSLKTSFKSRDVNSTAFHIIETANLENVYQVEPLTKCNVTIRFGIGTIPLEKRVPRSKNKSPTSNKSMKSINQPSTAGKNAKYFIAKYNIFVGHLFLKDIIIIGTLR